MSRLGKITRRTFLVAGVAVAGGAAFGYYQYRKAPVNPLTAADGEAVFNPWVIVRTDGVTVITPRAEMGQGVQTTLAALVAEEMDLPWDQVRVEHGPAAAAYYNAVATGLGAPFPEFRESVLKDVTQGVYGALGKLLGMQITGGSTSTIDAFDRMRRAGAAARAALVAVAAPRLGVDGTTLKTGNGTVIAPDGTAIRYGDLAIDAAKLAPPDNPELKDPKDWVLLGKSLPRLDMIPKVTGTATFGIDTRLPGILYAAVRATPRLGGAMEGFDATQARAIPGVKHVIDIGDGVAVVATNTWTAMRALDTIRIDWGPAPYPATTDLVFDHIAAALDDSPNSTLRDDGDVDVALNGDVITAEYRVPYLAHSTMEPMGATALFKEGKLTIWAGNQAPTILRDAAAKIAGIPAKNVTIHTPFMGGGFGRRAEFDVSNQATKLALALPGIPVKLTWTREEDMTHDFYRPGAVARMAGVMSDDAPRAFKVAIAAPSVLRNQSQRVAGFAPPGPDKLLVEGAFDQPYAIPNYRVSGHIANVAIPVGSWRSVGNSHNAFFHECFLDELAHARSLDPVEMRLRLIRPEHPPSAKVIETVAEMANWGSPLPDNRARGIAFTYSFGSPTAEIIEISQTENGIRLEQIWAAMDVGTALDPRNIEAQITSGIVYGLSAAIMGQITFADGMVEQLNFPDYDALRMYQMPAITTKILTNTTHMGGVGEPGTPPAAPALANAVFALTGQRIRELPLGNTVDFA